MRLIDADRLKEVFERNTGYDYHDVIDIQPTVEERPHGEWDEVFIDTIEGTIDCACSECGYPIIDYSVDLKLPNFCPNCGSDNRPKEGDKNEYD